jgi:hypothetical protein
VNALSKFLHDQGHNREYSEHANRVSKPPEIPDDPRALQRTDALSSNSKISLFDHLVSTSEQRRLER